MNKQAERALDSLEYADWPLAARIKLGAALIKFLLETAAWSEEGRPAFVHEVRSMQVRRRHGVIAMDEAVYSKVNSLFFLQRLILSHVRVEACSSPRDTKRRY